MSKLITVFGSTGTQGGSVIRVILSHPQMSKEYRIRAITRNKTQPAAKALEGQGIEVIQADLNDKTSVMVAVSGSYAVFGVTNFWETANFDNDVSQGRNIADASKEAGVQHLIWSSLPNVTKMTDGKLKNAKAFDSKATVEEYIRKLNIPATFYMSGVYMSNLKLATRHTPNGFVIAWPVNPTSQIPLIDAASDTGKWVTAILSKPLQTYGRRIQAASGWVTPEQLVSTISEIAGIKVSFQQISDEVFSSFMPPSVAAMRSEALICLREWNYYGPDAHAQLEESLQILQEPPTSFREFVGNNLPWVE